MKDVKKGGEVSEANNEFWSEPCGTNAYRKLGFDSMEAFDEWYFDFYPYLEKHIFFDAVGGRRVLEVGLGMGTVSERLVRSGAVYHGMDIAGGSVNEVKRRLASEKLMGEVTQGNVLACPWDDGYFDYVVSIGCLHHTGDLPGAISELVRVLKPGGKGVFMVYNAFSYRQWLSAPLSTWRQFRVEAKCPSSRKAEQSERAIYDRNSKGIAAPCTEFMGRKSILHLLKSLDINAAVQKENIGRFFMFPIPRWMKLKLFGPWVGLDLYVTFSK